MRRMHLCILSLLCAFFLLFPQAAFADKPIRWAELHITQTALKDCVTADISSHNTDLPTPLLELLTVLGVRYGGDFKRYRKADLDTILEKYAAGTDFQEIAANDKLYTYYKKVYGAVFGGFVGQHRVWRDNTWTEEYGVQVFPRSQPDGAIPTMTISVRHVPMGIGGSIWGTI